MIYANGITADINLERSAEMAAVWNKPVAERTPAEQATYDKMQDLSNAYESRAQQLANFKGSESDRVKLADRQAMGRFVLMKRPRLSSPSLKR